MFLSMPAHPPPEQSRIGQQPICAIIPPNHSTTVVTFVFLLCLAALRCRKYLPTSVLSCAGSDFFILTRTSSSALPCPPLPCSVLCCPVLSCLVLSYPGLSCHVLPFALVSRFRIVLLISATTRGEYYNETHRGRHGGAFFFSRGSIRSGLVLFYSLLYICTYWVGFDALCFSLWWWGVGIPPDTVCGGYASLIATMSGGGTPPAGRCNSAARA